MIVPRPSILLAVMLLAAGSGLPKPVLGEEATKLHPAAARRIENLLADAEVALAALRLTTPAHDNARDRYRQVLDFRPDDPRALAGLERVTDAYFGLALAAAEHHDRDEAERLFALGVEISPEHPSTRTVQQSIERLLSPAVDRFDLDPKHLAAFDPALAQRLHRLGARAKEQDLLVVIETPEDALGRWVYQRMNEAPPKQRLRARSEISATPRVTLRRAD